MVIPSAITVYEIIETASTNSLAKKLATEGAKNLTLVWAHKQSSGRGRYGRDWMSPEGNVFWSMILRPQRHWPSLSGLSHVAALAVHATITSLVKPSCHVQIKWPNDVLVDAKKISGILLEANCFTVTSEKFKKEKVASDWLIIGVGINVAHYPTNVSYPATSLHAQGTLDKNRNDVIAELTKHFVAQLETYIDKGSSHLYEQLRPLMVGIGQDIRVTVSDDPEDDIVGVFSDLDDDGQVIVAKSNGDLQKVSSGDVFFDLKDG